MSFFSAISKVVSRSVNTAVSKAVNPESMKIVQRTAATGAKRSEETMFKDEASSVSKETAKETVRSMTNPSLDRHIQRAMEDPANFTPEAIAERKAALAKLQNAAKPAVPKPEPKWIATTAKVAMVTEGAAVIGVGGYDVIASKKK